MPVGIYGIGKHTNLTFGKFGTYESLMGMRDLHCHILPGVDDGARNMKESLAMLAAAKRAGVTDIVCTPHARDPYFDYGAMLDAFDAFKEAAAAQSESEGGAIRVSMGFEVNWRKLCEIGMGRAKKLAFCVARSASAKSAGSPKGGDTGGSNAAADAPEFLFELPSNLPQEEFDDIFFAIEDLQAEGLEVIIAHPERYWAIQDNLDIAFDLVDAGCKLQASADFIVGGREGGYAKDTALDLLDAGLYSYIASDAHCVRHYEYLSAAMREFGSQLI